jgi:hypothetical protein
MKKLLTILAFLPLFAAAQRKTEQVKPNLHDSAAKYFAKMQGYMKWSGFAKDTAVRNKCMHFAATAEAHWHYWFELEDDSITRSKMKP